MLVQQRLITRVREVCQADERLDAALMYGSFASGEADAHSDIEFWLFFLPERRAEVDPRAWCAHIAPVTHLVRNEFGTDVAFFPGLVRGEFHFATTRDIASVGDWPARGADADRMVVLDRRGALRPVVEALPRRAAVPDSAEEVRALCGRFVNWLVLAHHVACRGEALRAWDALGQAHRCLLWMARLVEGSTEHWLTPSRCLEAELSSQSVAELRGTTGTASAEDVWRALRVAWRSGRRLWTTLAQRYDFEVPHDLLAELDSVL